MALELVHTSAPNGLRGRASGFCTVAMTTGMQAAFEERLEGLGGYRPSGEASASPPSFSHLRIEIAGRTWSVLSAVRAAPPDPSGRLNKLAHHLVVARAEQADAGPAWTLGQPGVVIDLFDGPPRWFPQPKELPIGALVGPRRADAWARASGDAGWAGALVNQFLLDPGRVSCVVHGHGVDPLALVDEAISLLPPRERWRVTFGTHFQQPVAGVHCAWRFCLAGTPAADEAPRRATGLFVDLDEALRESLHPKESRYATLAREGAAEWWTRDDDSALDAGTAGAVSDGARPGGDPDRGRVGVAAPSYALGAESGGRARSAVGGAWDDADDAGGKRRSAVAIGAFVVAGAVIGGAAAVVLDRFVLRGGNGDELLEVQAALAQSTRDASRLEEKVASLTRAVDQSEALIRDAERRAETLLAERDAARRDAEHSEARARAYEEQQARSTPSAGGATPSGAPGTAPESATPIATTPGVTAPGATAPRGATPGSSPGTGSGVAPGSGTGSGPRAPTDAAAVAAAPVPGVDLAFAPESLVRTVSHLGVISAERRMIGTLPRPITSLRIEFPPSQAAPRVRLQDGGRSARLQPVAAEQAGAGASPRTVATIEAEGPDLVFRWDASISAQRNAALLESMDAWIPLLTIVATLDDGSVRRVGASPRTIDVDVGRASATVTALGAALTSLRLLPGTAPEWTVDAQRTTGTTIVFTHASGSLEVALDPAAGTVKSRFLSPLHDELAAAEEALRTLEAERPSIPPDERSFHEAAVREARERVDQVRARVAREAPTLPSALPSVTIRDESLGRSVFVLRLGAGSVRGGAGSRGGRP